MHTVFVKRFVIVVAVIIAVLSLAEWSRSDAGLNLAVTRCYSGKAVLRLNATPGTEFSINFLHSYDKAYFQEHYRVLSNGRILLTHMTFKSTLNGQGFELGTYQSKLDGSAELSGINQEMEQVVFRLGSPDLANHALLIHNRRLPLNDYASAGDMLCIRVQSE